MIVPPLPHCLAAIDPSMGAAGARRILESWRSQLPKLKAKGAGRICGANSGRRVVACELGAMIALALALLALALFGALALALWALGGRLDVAQWALDDRGRLDAGRSTGCEQYQRVARHADMFMSQCGRAFSASYPR